MWHDEGTWIALGVSALFVMVGIGMHRAFVRVLRSGVAPAPEKEKDE